MARIYHPCSIQCADSIVKNRILQEKTELIKSKSLFTFQCDDLAQATYEKSREIGTANLAALGVQMWYYDISNE